MGVTWLITFGFKVDQRYFFLSLLALQPPMGVVFYSPLVGFSLLAYAVRSASVPTPHNLSQHIQANTRRGFIQSVS